MAKTELEILISLRDQASKGLGGISKSVGALGVAVGVFAGGAALAGVQALGSAVSGFLSDAITESRDAAAGLAQTEAVIKSTGGAAGVTADQIVELAGSLSKTTLYTDDSIQGLENLMLTFTGVKNVAGEGNDIFTQSTKIALDMATALGTDAAGGAIQLGKALNDPTKGIAALTRVGVTFTEQQKDQIKTLQASGDMLGAQKIILAELNKEFGGSAAAAAKADGGFHLFNQRLADVKQTIGDALQPALRALMGYMAGPGLDAVTKLGTALAGDLTTAITWLSGTGVPALVTGWQNLQAPMTAVGTFLATNLKPALTAAGIATLAYGATQIPVLITSLTLLIPKLIAQGVALTASLGPFALVAAAIYLVIRANDELNAQARDVVTEQNKTNEAMTAAAEALATYAENTAAQSPVIDAMVGRLKGLMQAHDDVATTLQRWDQADGNTRRSMHLSNAEIDAMRAQVKGLDGQIGALAGSLGHVTMDKLKPPKGVWSAYTGEITAAIQPMTAMATAIQLTDDQIKILTDDLTKAQTGGLAAFSTLIDSVATSYDQLAQTTSDHEDALAGLIADKAAAKTDAERQGIDDRIAAENTGYATQFAAQIVAQGEQLAAQRTHLGEMLIAQVETMAAMGTRSTEEAAALVAGIRTEYGVLPDLASTSFGAMQASISQWANDATVSADTVIGRLHETGATADSTRELMEQMAKKYEAELVENFLAGKINAEELKIAIAAIPSRVESMLNTNWADQLAQIRAIGGAMGALPSSKLIRIEAGIDPMLTRKSPSPIEQVMTAIGEFAARPHIFQVGTVGDLSALTSIASGSGGVAAAIQKLLATGDFAGGIFGKDEDDPFIDFLLTARKDATALKNILALLATKDFKGGILGLSEDDPFITALLKAAEAAKDLTTGGGSHIGPANTGGSYIGPLKQAIADLEAGMSIAGPKMANDFARIGDAATDAAAAVRGFVKASSGVRGGVGTLGGPDAGEAATSTGGGDPNETFAPRPGAAAEGTAAGAGAGMGFGDGWKTGIESIAPVIQDTTRMTFQQLHEVVLLPWQEDTQTFFGGAGFGFIGAASVGIMSAAGGMAEVAGAAGGMAGSSMVSSLSSAAAGVGTVVGNINNALGQIERNITITITTVYQEVGTPP